MSPNWQVAATKLSSKILCYYANPTRELQIVRVVDDNNVNLEKVVFPQQRILFEATPTEQLKIYTKNMGERAIAQIISCQKLQSHDLAVADTSLLECEYA